MSERRSGLLLVGSHKQEYYINELTRQFQDDDIEVVHRGNIQKELGEAARIELEYHLTGDRTPEHGERLLRHYLGAVAARAAGTLVVNIAPDGDGMHAHDITMDDWSLVLAADRDPEGTFFVHQIPKSSIYSSLTEGINGVPSERVVGGRFEVVKNRIFEVEGRHSKRFRQKK